MKSYLDLGAKILEQGQIVPGRNGYTLSIYGAQIQHDLQEGFPLLTSKHISFKHILHETLWYLMGTSKITYLKEKGINIWNDWATNDSIGPTYGVQWRNFDYKGYDQMRKAIELLKTNPYSRRIIINGWNPLQLHNMALPPCLVLIQFHVTPSRTSAKNILSTTVYQRSGDFCLGVPYDIAEMALLTHYVASIVDMEVGQLTIQYGDLHMYDSHITTFTEEQLNAETRPLPRLHIVNKLVGIDNINATDIRLIDYNPVKRIKYEIKP